MPDSMLPPPAANAAPSLQPPELASSGIAFAQARDSVFRVFLATLRRDLRIELRARDALHAMLFYALLVIVIFSFAFEAQDLRLILGGVLWLAFIFAGMISLDRSFLREAPENALAGLRISPASRSAIMAGKFASTLTLMFAVEVLLLPLFAAFFNAPHQARWGKIVLVVILGTWALAANGTYFSAMSTHARNRALLLPLLLLPISVPAILGMVEATQAFLSGQANAGFPLMLLIGYDIIFTALGLALADVVLDSE